MAAIAILEIQVRAIKWAITTRFLMKIGTQTKTGMLSSEITKAECTPIFKMAAASMLKIKVHAIKWILMKIGTQTKTTHAEFKSHKSGSLRKKKQQKLNVKNDIVLKGQRCMSAKL
jgi:hypothetical protein